MAKDNKIKEVIKPAITESSKEVKVLTEKEKLLDLYQQLKDLRINSISDLENLISRIK